MVRLKKITSDMKLCTYVSLFICSIYLSNFFAAVSEVISIPYSLYNTALKAVVVISFVLLIRTILVRVDRNICIYLIISSLVVLLGVVAFPENRSIFLENSVLFFSMCATFYIAISSIRDFGMLLDYLTKMSHIIAGFDFLLLLFIIMGKITTFSNGGYSMGLGYSTALPTMLLIYDGIKKKKALSAIGAMILFLTMIIGGSRGPLFEVVLFFFFVSVKKQGKQKYEKALLIGAFLVAVLACYRPILQVLASLLKLFGIMRTKVIVTMNTSLFYSSGRSEMYETLIQEIIKHPFAVRGINAEWHLLDVYAHNFVLELLYQFGIILGGVLVILVFALMIRCLCMRINNELRILCLCMLFASVPSLLVSGSIWTNFYFWGWIALCHKALSQSVRKLDASGNRIVAAAGC